MKNGIRIISWLLPILCACTKLDRNNSLDANYGNIGGVRVFEYKVVNDNNMDGKVNRGENFELEISLKNYSFKDLEGIKAFISCSNEQVSIINGNEDFSCSNGTSHNIMPNDIVFVGGYNKIAVRVPSKLDKQKVVFNLNIRDAAYQIWQDSFELEIHNTNALIEVDTLIQVSHNYYDNVLDGVSAGETGRFILRLINNGTSRVNSLRANVFSLSNNIENFSGISGGRFWGYSTISSNDYIDAGDYASSNSYIQFEVKDGVSPDELIEFNAVFEDELGNTWNSLFSIKAR